ncbi:MAG: hypothetical protein HZB16_14465 [Armatimonadetes bacterium]|nr:hypothetical protein [Armatimonadota bacterium]
MARLAAEPAMSSEAFLNTLGVNTHLGGLTRDDPWNTDTTQIGEQLRYLGVRLVRDWMVSPRDLERVRALHAAWRLDGRFWTSIAEGSTKDQRDSLALTQALARDLPGLLYAVGGPNEEDDEYAQKLGATLPDAALVQRQLYDWAHPLGLLVSQMEFGAGWTAANGWQGNYNPTNTGSKQNYTPGPADFAAAHTYLSDPAQRPASIINMMRANARLCTLGKPVAHTEVGGYYSARLSPRVYGQYLVMGALDSAAAGDVGYLVYGLQDSKPEATYGFYTFPGGIAHPSARFFHTLTTLLASKSGCYGPGAKPTFTPGVLPIAVAGKEVSHLLLAKPTGEFVVALWSEQLMNDTAHEVPVTVEFSRAFANATVYDVQDGLTPIAALHNAARCELVLEPSDTYLVVLD